MIHHEYINEFVQVSEFDNGYCVKVNFKDNSYTITRK